METRRIGRFYLPAAYVERCSPEATRIMGMCSIYRAEHMLWAAKVEYFAASFRFREVPEGEVVPLYQWQMNEDGSVDCIECDAYGVPK